MKNMFPMLVSFLGIENHYKKRNRCNKNRTIHVMRQGDEQAILFRLTRTGFQLLRAENLSFCFNAMRFVEVRMCLQVRAQRNSWLA